MRISYPKKVRAIFQGYRLVSIMPSPVEGKWFASAGNYNLRWFSATGMLYRQELIVH